MSDAVTTPVATTPPAKKPFDRRLAAAAVGLFVAGWLLGQTQPGGLPWQPEKPRPVLTALARLAKFGLWLIVVEPAPQNCPPMVAKHDPDYISHREGW